MKSLQGSFLVAKPILNDPNFAQSVVLMIQHNVEGAFGLVVNRSAPVSETPFPVYLGGPCPSEGGVLMLHGHPEWIYTETEREQRCVAPDIYLGDATCVERVTDGPEDASYRFRIVVGYSGWGPDQLEREMVSKAWAITPANGDLLFDVPADDLWQKLAPPTSPGFSVN